MGRPMESAGWHALAGGCAMSEQLVLVGDDIDKLETTLATTLATTREHARELYDAGVRVAPEPDSVQSMVSDLIAVFVRRQLVEPMAAKVQRTVTYGPARSRNARKDWGRA